MRRAIALLLVAFLLSACGNKGPLYLPKPTAAPPAKPAAQKPAGETSQTEKPQTDKGGGQ